MVLKYHISPVPSLMEDMVVRIYEAGSEAPGQEVWEQVIAQAGVGGHPNPTTITATGLDTVVHIVRLYTAVSAQLLHNYTAEPRQDGVVVFDPIRFKIGDGNLYTPLAGSNSYSNPLLEGLAGNEYSVHRNNYGYLFPDVIGVTEPHIQTDDVLGAWTFIGNDQFNNGEEFLIQRSAQIVSNVINTSVVGKWFAGFLNVSSNTDYISAHLRNLIRFIGSPSYFFRAASAPPIGYAFVFQNYGAGAANSIAKVVFENAPLLWNNATKGEIDIPLYTEAAFVFDGNNWNVIYINDSRWQNSTSASSNSILGSGETVIPDVAFGADVNVLVTHGLNISGDYRVFYSIKSAGSATAGADNNMQIAWYHHSFNKPNAFFFTVGDPYNQVTSFSIAWLLIKT